MQSWSLRQRRQGVRVGMVPTMGSLHAGHLALMAKSRGESDATVVSIFVNPTQFGSSSEYARYPRDEAGDLTQCRNAGVDVVFAPEAAAMYAPDASVYLDETALSRGLCGEHRPGHFRGVCTVVAKLFNIVLPDSACFGQKDYQQVAAIRRMIRDMNFPVRLIVVPTVREADGVALSSRNALLSAAERRQAVGLNRALEIARQAVTRGEADTAGLCDRMRSLMESEFDLRVEYVAIVDGDTLQDVRQLGKGCVALIAAYAGKTRLIDNALL
jgi:pantoate--beta-alanine ligase